MEQAYEMAFDALGLAIVDRKENNENIPSPTIPKKIAVEENVHIVLVEFDMATYRRKHGSKAVKKTLSIPEWLNEEAMAVGINFSQVLQEALMQKLGV